jgi:hypothetical protein
LELSTRCAVFLLRCHQARITTTQSLAGEINALQQVIRGSVGDYRTLLGTNLAALRYMKSVVDEKRNASDLIYDMEGGDGNASKSASSKKRRSGGQQNKGKGSKKPKATF